MQVLPSSPWLALFVTWVALVGLGEGVRGALRAAPPGPPWRETATFQFVALLAALAAAAIEGLGAGALGLRAPSSGAWAPALFGGLGLGATTTLVVLVARLRGLRDVVGRYSLGAIVLWVWIWSSLCEEVVCRGFFQGSTGGTASTALATLLPSALLFGGLHLPLVRRTDGASAAVIVVATTGLGLLAAWARAASGSLYPAIGAHVAFNVGGIFGTMIYVVGRAIATGEAPRPPA